MSLAGAPRESVREAEDQEVPSEYQRLRQLLLGPEQAAIESLQRRLDNPGLRAEELSQIVAEAIALRARRDRTLQKALNPIMEEALRVSVARNPELIADTLFPIIGRAVRRAVAQSLRGIVESLNDTLERSVSWEAFKWRIESLRTGKKFAEIVLARSLRYRVEQVFAIHREDGLLMAHVSRAPESDKESEMISGMLTAVQDFIHDSFSETSKAELDTVELGEFNVWIQHGPKLILAAVVTGTPPRELRTVLQRKLEELHTEFGPLLDSYGGDPESAAGMLPLLQSCLVGRQPREARRRTSRAWLWAVVPVFGVLVAFAVNLLIQRHRWDLAVRDLRAEPGIVLTSAERLWGGYRLTGLRDPMAEDPETIFRREGIDPARVTARWELYTSMDPRFQLPRHLAEEKAFIERQEILFQVNSSHLDPEQLLKLADLEAHLIKLRDYASAEHRAMKLEITGHTDPTGQEDKNATLSEKRAEEVLTALTDRGFAVDSFIPLAVGSRVPVQRKPGPYLPELSRRVTFHVMLGDSQR